MENINHTVEIIAKWLEVLGFLVSIVTIIKVFFLDKRIKHLQTKHLFQGRIEEHLRELKRTSLNTANLINAFASNIKTIRIEVNQCHQNCLSIRKKIEGRKLLNLDKLIKISNAIIKNKLDINDQPNWVNNLLGKRPIAEKDIDEFYEILTSLISETEHLIKDIKKSLK